MTNTRTFLIAAALLAAGAPAANATEKPAANSALLQQMRAGLSAEQYVTDILQSFDDVAGETGSISAAEMRGQQTRDAALRRANAIGAILRYDLNGDLLVSSSEIINAQTNPAQRAARAKKTKTETLGARQTRLARAEADRLIQRYDSNRDGAISMTEMVASIDQDEAPRRNGLILTLLATQLGGDGKLTRPEVKTAAQRTFKLIDKNKDRRISAEEYAATQHPTRLAMLIFP
jgi:Ca2+-binding EF-hand superfamily protein